MDLSIGQKFFVEMEGFDAHFNAEIINISTDDPYREFELKITERYNTDSGGHKYKCADTFIEVEKAWFTRNPRRKITPVLV